MADILRPEVIWIEGRCYRINDTNTEVSAFLEHDLYEDEITYNDSGDDGDEDDFEVMIVDNSRYMTSLHVSKHYLGSIIGKKGAIKNRIERDTKTDIKIPRQGQAGDVTIFGPTPANVKAARRRISIIVMSSRMKEPSTHFISIPMNSEEIIKNFDRFKETVLKKFPSNGMEESLFIRPQKLHLTLGVMCLMDNEERVLVSRLLTEAKEKIVMPMLRGNTPVRIRLKGLSYMNDDPKHIDVLYGKVQEDDGSSGLIQNLSEALVEYFSKSGFMNKHEYGREKVKLHVTLINSKYRSRSSSNKIEECIDTHSSRSWRREAFDGSKILSELSDYDFGVQKLNEIHLSQRHSMGPDGYYQPTCVISCKTG